MNNPAEYTMLVHLANRYCDADLDASELAQLQQLLAQNVALRKVFFSIASVHAQLVWQSDPEARRLAGQLSSRLAKQTLATDNATDVSQTQATTAEPAKVVLRSPAMSLRHHFGRLSASLGQPVVWSIFGVGLAFSVYVLVISWGLLSKELAEQGNPNAKVVDGRDLDFVPVATIRDSAGVDWSAAPLAGIPAENDRQKLPIKSAESLEINAGIVELQLAQGATLVVEGPAKWKIDGDNRASVTLGKIVAKVPPRAVGFSLDTPTARIVDLGTEFGVIVGSSTTEVHVLQGEVETEVKSAAATQAPIRLRKGEALAVDQRPGEPSKVTPKLAENSRFVDQVRPNSPAKLAPLKIVIEAGDGSPEYKFPTIASPTADDMADASRGKASITAIGKLRLDQATSPATALIDGKGSHDRRHVCFLDPQDGKLLLSLGQLVRVDRVVSFSWTIDGTPIQAPQGYDLFGSDAETAPPTDGYLPKHGWQYLATVNTEAVLGVPPKSAMQQAASIARQDGSPLGTFRHLLWVTDRHRMHATNFDELDVYGEPVNGERQ